MAASRLERDEGKSDLSARLGRIGTKERLYDQARQRDVSSAEAQEAARAVEKRLREREAARDEAKTGRAPGRQLRRQDNIGRSTTRTSSQPEPRRSPTKSAAPKS